MLRRILRRASRYGRQIYPDEPIIHRLVGTLVEEMGETYPEVVVNQEYISKLVESEEESFGKTLDRGITLFAEAADDAPSLEQPLLLSPSGRACGAGTGGQEQQEFEEQKEATSSEHKVQDLTEEDGIRQGAGGGEGLKQGAEDLPPFPKATVRGTATRLTLLGSRTCSESADPGIAAVALPEKEAEDRH